MEKMFSFGNKKIFSVLKKIGIIGSIMVVGSMSLLVLYSYFYHSGQKSRDTLRLSHVIQIQDALKIAENKNGKIPLPDEKIELHAKDEIISTQGYFTEKTAVEIGSPYVQDPKENTVFPSMNSYTYAVNTMQNEFQIIAFFEEDANQKRYSLYNSSRNVHSFGKNVGIAVESETQRPAQEGKLDISLLDTTDSYDIYYGENDILSGDSSIIKALAAHTKFSQSVSCKEILNSGIHQDGKYFLISAEGKTFEVYCDMNSDGGGWTRIIYKKGPSTCFQNSQTISESTLKNLLTQDIAFSDKVESVQSELSWILRNIETNEENFDFKKLTNVANCKAPNGENWSQEYGSNSEKTSETLLSLYGRLDTLGSWKKMFFGCQDYKNIGEIVKLNIGGFKDHSGWFVHSNCNNYSYKDNSITTRWTDDLTRSIWVR